LASGASEGQREKWRRRRFLASRVRPCAGAASREHEALVTIETLDVLRGELPRRALALVLEWAAAHRDELRADWNRARSGQTLEPIAPLE
jgi:hypothetical protein